ncbi:unnamed protein product [Durusdinium trenchii]|uniref:Uncharacterized protein n=1 Tax=Durusdinium trenchii TaxID=1381693 RepID=A0ABP0MJL1_9DINO
MAAVVWPFWPWPPLWRVVSGHFGPRRSLHFTRRIGHTKRHWHRLRFRIRWARSLLWNAVCKNIKERLVNGLAADGWRVDVFLFLSLRDDARPGRVARNYRPEQMAYCQKLLMPVHSEWMESVYVPLPHGCAKGQEPGYTRKVKKKEKDRAAFLRVFSQCKRLEIAYDFIETYEQTAWAKKPKHFLAFGM